jgi:acyl phosphate:glycerol-3-phosphate acyltransferase
MINEVLIILLSYLIGSLPFGLIISFCFGYGDIRKHGSGNIGTTNVLRCSNKLIALCTLICDSGKIIVAILLAEKMGMKQDYLVGSVAILGHLFSIFLKFQGGKGVASFLGFSLYLFPKIALLLIMSWLITFIISRYSSLAAIVAAFVAIIALIILQPLTTGNLLLVIALILLIIIKHKSNIIRLINGTESKFVRSKKA